MVEGHGVHRVAAAHKSRLLGHRFKASSPNGRFVEGAKLIDSRWLTRIEAIGKNLFYFWDEGPSFNRESTVVIHIHFGMSGQFKTGSSDLLPSTVTPTSRLLLVNEEKRLAALLSCMTLDHGGYSLYEKKSSLLGPDPLRDDADRERLWLKMSATKKPIGQILMDQACVAGIGNIYRAEILYKSRLHPDQPANTVPRECFERLWQHSVLCLQRGFKTGSILTVDPEDAKVFGPPHTRRYIYNQRHCPRCRGLVKTWSMATRTVYCCEVCQPFVPDTDTTMTSTPEKVKVPAKVFNSHCAEDDTASLLATPMKMTVAALVKELKERGLPARGKKAELVCRLEAALITTPATVGASAITSTPMTPSGISMLVTPGTTHLGAMSSAAAAAREKRLAGENRAVEHVALHDEKEAEEVEVKEPARRKRKRQDSRRNWAAEVAIPNDPLKA